ncbi:hypothetical protein BP00DRAFT_462468 [Aspergillus indologenus CBS 114.80]|uniref:DUF6536 domain-containing protein n=1 Tax=Aspergillus indologenus CBS 114.80 TaxID=1450541 RepID=A0A2V5IRL9_9EURO|nr:hypothetical protein BP00DRAFT_462468 [Aspergillus indologenus CBS 114.80]
MGTGSDRTREGGPGLLSTWWDQFRYTTVPLSSSNNTRRDKQPRWKTWLPHGLSQDPEEGRAGREWIKGAVVCTWITATILALNSIMLIVALIFAYRQSSNRGQFQMVALYTGQCALARHSATGIHVVINVLGTILLGASSYVMQCLGAPSRSDIDRAHASSRWLVVGSFSFRNFAVMSPKRKVLWGLLLLSSTPIHMIYNSVIFSSIAELESGNLLIPHDLSSTEALVDDTASRESFRARVGLDPAVVQQRIFDGTFTNLTGKECWAKRADDTLYSTLVYVAERKYFHNTSSLWVDGALYPSDHNYHPVEPVYWSYRGDLDIGLYPEVPVLHCLMDESRQRCQLLFSPPIAIVVIICNAIKLSCMILSVGVRRRDLFLTLGDALASFLTRPDPTTRGHCLLSRAEVAEGLRLRGYSALPLGRHQGHLAQAPSSTQSSKPSSVSPSQSAEFRHHPSETILISAYGSPKPIDPRPKQVTPRQRWYHAVSWPRRIILLFCYASCIAISFALLFHGIGSDPFHEAMSIGFSQYARSYVANTNTTNIVALLLVANTPQLGLSVLYFLTNGAVTGMLLDAELQRYATRRRALRCSWPRGPQRSTYYLTLPYRYSIPLLAGSAALHWLVSQSFFFVYVRQVDLAQRLISDELRGCAYSPLAIFITIWVGLAGMMVVVGLGFRRFENRMPLAGGCSLVLSALCHPAAGDAGAAEKPVMWGEVSPDPAGTLAQYDKRRVEERLVVVEGAAETGETGAATAARDGTMEGYPHCSFTSMEVTAPRLGQLYA